VRKRRTIETDFRLAGPDHAVVSLVSKGRTVHVCRHEVCAECPWRQDSPVGAFPVEAYRISAATAYDMAQSTFACHMSGKGNPATCAGFLLQQGAHNLSVRMSLIQGRLDLGRLKRTYDLYENYRAMAIANGVDPEDPVLANCRDDGQLEP